MTQKDKELLLKDLCARLPYGVICKTEKGEGHLVSINQTLFGTEYGLNINSLKRDYFNDGNTEEQVIKPYLRPMSSMTDKDLTEFLQIKGMNLNSDELKIFRRGKTAIVSTLHSYSRNIDWLNKNHFDYRDLIEKELAIDATGLNIY